MELLSFTREEDAFNFLIYKHLKSTFFNKRHYCQINYLYYLIKQYTHIFSK